ncbi:nucleotidyl transferase family protein [Mesoterricola silvestris]|uniref:[Citrate [pro-3S]-lyase] ligase n=1 Tax=Mesoterricola silvestris TaxID=2927979 RepID=A0AA48KB95_9BACT|nr:hypothetical protein [Mesoterricola silvestris]BDU74107.1 [Citrate [pro-3S]-lyase] ligase [Mesoterricola silvestris]
MFDQPTEREAQELIESLGLRFEPGVDDWAGFYDNGRLAACGARKGYVLKMLAIAPEFQGTDTLGALVTRLILSGLAAGHETLFLFTRPQTASTFEALNFRILATHGTAALLEHGPGFEAYLAAHPAAPGRNGAIVLNGNPFTLGHLHLAEHAARQVDRLYLFVVSEDCSVFPFAARLAMARAATAHLPNVTVLETSRYAVSAGTFPAYFLKRRDEAALAQMRLDLDLFAGRIAPAFSILRRFAGDEPLCPATRAYNEAMAEVLPGDGVAVSILPRFEAGGAPVSATRVREAFAAGDFQRLAALVPPSTLQFLRSDEARPIAGRLRSPLKGA